jgi:hypothetical protein
MLISKPYMQRRAYATIRKAWPEVEPVCASEDITFDEYLKSIGDDIVSMRLGKAVAWSQHRASHHHCQ